MPSCGVQRVVASRVDMKKTRPFRTAACVPLNVNVALYAGTGFVISRGTSSEDRVVSHGAAMDDEGHISTEYVGVGLRMGSDILNVQARAG